jgi:general L-amino acid transport system substrate-binding protein
MLHARRNKNFLVLLFKKERLSSFLSCTALLACLCASHPAQAGKVLDEVKAANRLACGTVSELNDETIDDTHGNLSALGADMCRAVAAAITDGKGTAQINTYPTEALAYQALEKGEIALIEGASPNTGKLRRYNVSFLTPVYFDGQGLLVHKDRGLRSLKDLDGKMVCYIGGTDADNRLHAAADPAGIKLGYFPFQEIGEMEAALVGGHCDAQSHDASELAVARAAFHGRRNDYEIPPDRLSLDPLSPVVRNGDAEFAHVVDWVLFTLVQAQIDGVTRANADAMRSSPNMFVQSLVGSRRGMHWGLYLAEDWGYQAIKAVGNYGEVLDRDVGAHSPLRLEPGPNRPWTEGGMMWGAPFN